MDFQIKYLSWKAKVDSYVKYLTNIEIYDFSIPDVYRPKIYSMITFDIGVI